MTSQLIESYKSKKQDFEEVMRLARSGILTGFYLPQISVAGWLADYVRQKMTIYGCYASGMYGMQASDQSRRILLFVARGNEGQWPGSQSLRAVRHERTSS